MDTKLVSFDSPTLREHFKYLGWCHTTSQKIFTAPWSLKSHQKLAFSMLFQGFKVQHLPLKAVSKRKNRHLLTFLYIKTVPGVVRSCCLLLQVPMIMKKCLQTYYDIAIALENFLRSLKSSVVIHKIVTFYIILNHFGSKSGLKGYETQKNTFCSRFCK